MRHKKFFCMLLVCIFAVGCLGVNARAISKEDFGVNLIVERASGRFSLDIEGNTLANSSTSFPLEVGETVTINASYSPRSASVDFGLIAPDGLFYSLNTDNGSINKSIEVNQRGHYTLAIVRVPMRLLK